MSLLDATERGRPIMEYVRTLESKVREYQAMESGLRWSSFSAGALVGVAVGFPVGAVLEWLLRR